MRNKKVVENITITGLADKGKGVGRDPSGRVIFVDHVAPGDVVDVLIRKRKSDYYIGVPINFIKLSEDRIEPFCEHFGICGGCKFQHIPYDIQLKNKETHIQDVLQRIGKIKIGEMLPILGCEKPEYYRNKMEFTFSNRRWLTRDEISAGTSNLDDVLGFHRPGAFDKIVEIKHCYLQEDPSNELRNTIQEIAKEQKLGFYDVREQKGLLRHIMIRITAIGEIMLIFSFFYKNMKQMAPLLDEVIRRFPQLTTVYYCINSKVNDFVLDCDMIPYHGKGYIEEEIGDIRFKIGPKSFFQTNSRQAKVLYDVIVDFAQLEGTENVYDLYTGIGSIALYLAKYCKQVVGIEEVDSAIVDAKENTVINNIDNAVFVAGDVKEILTPEFARQHGKPDVLITDPPRAGMHPMVVNMLIQLEAPKIVYVSCKPSTQARDLNWLSEKYNVLKSRSVDMFPHTHHVENVVLLELKDEYKQK